MINHFSFRFFYLFCFIISRSDGHFVQCSGTTYFEIGNLSVKLF